MKAFDYENRLKALNTVSWYGLIVNIFLAFMKIITGIITSSIALLADGIDTSTDIATSLFSLLAIRISNKPPDKTHPYGHEAAETVGQKIISFIILYAGFRLLVSSVNRLFSDVVIFQPLVIMGVALTSSGLKYTVYRYKLSIGKKYRSSATIADALNMRNDVWISIITFTGALIYFLTGFARADAFAGLFISILILKTGVELLTETSEEFMGSTKLVKDIYCLVLKTIKKFPCVYNPHKIRVRKYGYKYFVDMHVEFEPEMTVKQANEICSRIEKSMKEENPFIMEVLIHPEPIGNLEEEGFKLYVEDLEKMCEEYEKNELERYDE